MFPGVEIAPDASAMLESPDIDVVALATPVFSHFDLARRALEQGKHVWVEKPMTTTSAEAEQFGGAGRAKKQNHHGGPHLHFHQRGA